MQNGAGRRAGGVNRKKNSFLPSSHAAVAKKLRRQCQGLSQSSHKRHHSQAIYTERLSGAHTSSYVGRCTSIPVTWTCLSASKATRRMYALGKDLTADWISDSTWEESVQPNMGSLYIVQ